MRSSLTEPRPAPNIDTYRAWSAPGFQRTQTPPPTVAKPQRSFPLAPSEGWLPLLLLAIAVYSVVYSVTAAITINHTTVLWITTALGLFSGLIVSKSRYFSQAFLHIGACLVGFWIALLLTSTLAYHESPLSLLSSLRGMVLGGFALAGTQNSDMIFLFYLSFLCFFLGYFGAWLIYRAHLPWLVALVYTSIMIVNLNYVSKHDLSFLIVILVGSLVLLIARIHLASQLTQWKSDGLYTDQIWLRGMTARFLRIATLFMLLILPFSWLLPALSQPASGVVFWNNLDNAWANITHGHLSALSSPNSLFSPYQPASDFFGDQLTIAGSVNLPNGPVLSYTTGSATQGQYLEAFTFEQFDGHTWTPLMSSANQSFPMNTPLPQEASSQNYSQLHTSITIIQPPGGTKPYIFAPSQPYNFNVPVTLLTDDSGIFIAAWTQTSPLSANEHYDVVSQVSTATHTDLATLPLPNDNNGPWVNDTTYSDPLQQHYLQTPNTLSPEVLNMARIWTSGTTNTYDAVAALQAHLSNQREFTYSLTNEPVPANIDAVTWLLHTHKGFCTYYATAMAMMARLLKIPARIVNGFSQGHYDSQKKAWIVNGSEAHSWVQIYFPTYGWINFDPTPGFTNTTSAHPSTSPTVSPTHPTVSPKPTTPANKLTPGTLPTASAHHLNGDPASSFVENTTGANILIAFALLVLLCALLLLGVAIARYRASRSPRSAVTSVYARLCRIASLIGSPPAAWQTPYEYTFALSRRFPEASSALRRVADLFVRERWAAPQQGPAPTEERALTHLWPSLRNTILRSPFKKGR